MTKKVLATVLAVSIMLSCGAIAASTDQFEGHWELDTTRTVIFASDGGTYIHPVAKEIGTVISFDEYVPVKDGYIFDLKAKEIQIPHNHRKFSKYAVLVAPST